MALLIAAMMVVLTMVAALAVDLTLQTNRQQNLRAALDSAAQAGAFFLPDGADDARSEALSTAEFHDATEIGDLEPSVDFWCVVASTGTAPNYVPDATQIPATCNPGTSPYTDARYAGLACNSELCAIPCPSTAGHACNTIRLYQGREVPFAFAKAGGFDTGSTGAMVSVACKGSCGTVSPNPLDVAIVADRTGSMSPSDVRTMQSGIKSMLTKMTPGQQYVSLGVIGRADTTTRSTGDCNGRHDGLIWPSGSVSRGQWMPLNFYNDYLSGSNVNSNSMLSKAIECLDDTSSSTGTALASPLKAAARYLLDYDSNNLSSLPAREIEPTKVLIFETDGQPNEQASSGGSASLLDPGDIFSNRSDSMYVGSGWRREYYYSGGQQACQNFLDVAANAKAEGVLVITIGYNLSSTTCDQSDRGARRGADCSPSEPCDYEDYADPSTVLSVLADAASAKVTADGTVPSAADSDCSNSAEREAENADGDYFFCAATGTDMEPIFKTALSQASKGIRLLQLP